MTCQRQTVASCNGIIFDLITEWSSARTEIDDPQLSSLVETPTSREALSVLDVLGCYPHSHLSLNALLKADFDEDANCQYAKKDEIHSSKDLAFYGLMGYRIFLPRISTSDTIHL